MSAKPLTVGILGGMGPEAANRLSSLITELADAPTDRDHIPVICFNNPAIPSRVESIRGTGENCLPTLVETARSLVRAGANFLVMPCNCAHLYLPALRNEISIPFIDMISETIDRMVETFPRAKNIGILASSPTIELGLYGRPLSEWGIRTVVPVELDQARVMDAIYGLEGIKAGKKKQPRKNLIAVGNNLATHGAEIVIAACTEVSLVLDADSLDVPVVDPLRIVATAAIEYSRNGLPAQGRLGQPVRRSTAAGI